MTPSIPGLAARLDDHGLGEAGNYTDDIIVEAAAVPPDDDLATPPGDPVTSIGSPAWSPALRSREVGRVTWFLPRRAAMGLRLPGRTWIGESLRSVPSRLLTMMAVVISGEEASRVGPSDGEAAGVARLNGSRRVSVTARVTGSPAVTSRASPTTRRRGGGSSAVSLLRSRAVAGRGAQEECGSTMHVWQLLTVWTTVHGSNVPGSKHRDTPRRSACGVATDRPAR